MNSTKIFLLYSNIYMDHSFATETPLAFQNVSFLQQEQI